MNLHATTMPHFLDSARRTWLLAGLLALAGPLAAQQRLLPAQSEIVFTARQMGVPVEGRFRRFDAQIAFDPKKPEASSIALAIDLLSATMGHPDVDAELPKPEWFDARRSARAEFQSTAIKAVGSGRYQVAGKLTIKGISREVVVPLSLAQGGAPPNLLTTASGSFGLRRLEYRIGDGDWKDTSMVADEVQVRLKFTVQGIGPL